MSIKSLLENHKFNTTKETLDQVIDRYQRHPDADNIYIHTTKGMRGKDGRDIGPKIGKSFTERPNSSKHNPLGVYVYNIKKLGVFTAYRKYDEYNYIIRANRPLPVLGKLTDDQITLVLATLNPSITRDKINQYITGRLVDHTGRITELSKKAVSQKLYNMIVDKANQESVMGRAAAMTNLWIKCGFDGLYDPGYGILDSLADPAQGVFFKNSAFTVLELVSPTEKTRMTNRHANVDVNRLAIHDHKWVW